MESLLQPPPAGPVQGGTFAGSALGLAAASVTLDLVTSGPLHPSLIERAGKFFEQLQAIFDRSPLPARVQSIGCMFHIYVGTREPVTSYGDMRDLDRDLARRFFLRCIEEGLYFHTDFSVSAAHTTAILDDALGRIEHIANEPGW
jgi:glutamate-1-semialdehyde 2,1-aminomutase